MGELTRSFGKPDNVILKNQLIRQAGVLTAGELRELNMNANEPVILPGLSGTPNELLVSLEKTLSAFDAARRATELMYDSTPGLTGLKQTGLAEFDKRQVDIVHNLFSGKVGTDPVIARLDAIVALRTASEMYRELSKSKPTNS